MVKKQLGIIFGCFLLTVFAVGNQSAVGQIILSEVLYDAPAGDDGLEWVELFNESSVSIDLSTFSIGYGGTDYTTGVYQLSGTIGPGQYFVLGGPLSETGNANPTYDLIQVFDPNIQNSGSTADGLALFDVLATEIDSTTIPIDVVIYGTDNNNGLIDETGNVGVVDVGDAPSSQSIEFDGIGWSIRPIPTPGTGSLVNTLFGDVNLDGFVNLLDVQPFVDLITIGAFQEEADINQDGSVDLLDVQPFVDILVGN